MCGGHGIIAVTHITAGVHPFVGTHTNAVHWVTVTVFIVIGVVGQTTGGIFIVVVVILILAMVIICILPPHPIARTTCPVVSGRSPRHKI